jgi:very-short-patch-repair endonuclease
MTEAERKLWLRLREWRPAGYHFRRQAPLGPFIADFACQHGFRVLRFWNNQVFGEFDGVLETIWLALTACPPPPLLKE